MKMTKTMKDLLSRAQENKSRPNIGVVQRTCGAGAQGGRINHGMRESAALSKLLELGLVEIVKQYKSAIPNSGHTLWVYDTTYRVIQTMPSDADYLAALGPCGK
jgi:hypothetical protein